MFTCVNVTVKNLWKTIWTHFLPKIHSFVQLWAFVCLSLGHFLFFYVPTPSSFLFIFCPFQTQILQKKLQASARFKLASSELKVSTMTAWPPPRPSFSILFNDHSRSLFLSFRIFYTIKSELIKVDDEWIRTADLWFWMQPLYQLCHLYFFDGIFLLFKVYLFFKQRSLCWILFT